MRLLLRCTFGVPQAAFLRGRFDERGRDCSPPQRLLPRSGFPRCRRRVFRSANLSALPPCTHPFFDARRCHTARGLPPPAGLLGRIGVAARWRRSGAFCSDSVPEYRAPIRLLAPHRPELRSRLYPHLPPGGSRPGFAFPVARPFVCECRTIPAIPAPWTIPGLPESLTLFPTVSPAHTLVRRGGTQTSSPP